MIEERTAEMPDRRAGPEVDAPDWDAVGQELACPLCDYNLRDLREPRCPECGHRFDWQDLTDPRRRKHPWLFEHHPDRNVWSFWKTARGGLRPLRFWTAALAMLGLVGLAVAWDGLEVNRRDNAFIVLSFAILALLYVFVVVRLGAAYARYLRFDRPWATVIASQIVFLLLVLNHCELQWRTVTEFLEPFFK